MKSPEYITFWGNVLVDADLTLRAVRKKSAAVTGLRGFFGGKHRKVKEDPLCARSKEIDISSVPERSSKHLDITVPSLSLDLQEATEAQTNELRGEEHWTGAAVSALIGDALQAVSRWWNAPVLVKVSESDPVDRCRACLRWKRPV